MKNKIFKIGYYALLLLIVIIAGLLIISVFPLAGNYEFMVVQSGSMEPAVKVGSVVVVRPVNEYEVGDIVTFKFSSDGFPLTHRIHDVEVVEGRVQYITKGDANEEPDRRRVTKRNIIGKVLLDIPYIGYVVSFAQKPLGFALVIILPALIIVVDEVRKIYLEFNKNE